MPSYELNYDNVSKYLSSDIIVFPTSNSLNEGRLTIEENMKSIVTRITNRNYALKDTDFLISKDSNSSNTIIVSSGQANINGYHVICTKSNEIKLTSDKYPSGKYNVYIQLIFDTNNHVQGVETVDNKEYFKGVLLVCDNSDLDDRKDIILKLGEIEWDGNSITKITININRTLIINANDVFIDDNYYFAGSADKVWTNSLQKFMNNIHGTFLEKYGDTSFGKLCISSIDNKDVDYKGTELEESKITIRTVNSNDNISSLKLESINGVPQIEFGNLLKINSDAENKKFNIGGFNYENGKAKTDNDSELHFYGKGIFEGTSLILDSQTFVGSDNTRTPAEFEVEKTNGTYMRIRNSFGSNIITSLLNRTNSIKFCSRYEENYSADIEILVKNEENRDEELKRNGSLSTMIIHGKVDPSHNENGSPFNDTINEYGSEKITIGSFSAYSKLLFGNDMKVFLGPHTVAQGLSIGGHNIEITTSNEGFNEIYKQNYASIRPDGFFKLGNGAIELLPDNNNKTVDNVGDLTIRKRLLVEYDKSMDKNSDNRHRIIMLNDVFATGIGETAEKNDTCSILTYAHNAGLESDPLNYDMVDKGAKPITPDAIILGYRGTNEQIDTRTRGNLIVERNLNVDLDVKAHRVYNAVYNDYADNVKKDKSNEYEPGDIISKKPNSDEYTLADESNKKLVVGVYSDTFGHLLGGDKDKSIEENKDNYIPIGVSGNVRVKVIGSIEEGDLITVSDIKGVGKLCKEYIPGTIVGKCLETNYDKGIKRVLMQIMLA